MIPHEVALIAEELGLYFKGCRFDGIEHYSNLAYKIYNKLQAEKEARCNLNDHMLYN